MTDQLDSSNDLPELFSNALEIRNEPYALLRSKKRALVLGATPRPLVKAEFSVSKMFLRLRRKDNFSPKA